MIYLDYAADAPIHPDVTLAINDAIALLAGKGANPSSLHTAGRKAQEFLEESRQRVAHVLGADAREVIFTGGGTQADALAVIGMSLARLQTRPQGGRLLISALEHDAIVHAANYVCQHAKGCETASHADTKSLVELCRIPVDHDGLVDTSVLEDLCQTDLLSVACMMVCNENGVVEPVQKVIHTVRISEKERVPLIVDAVQALGRLRLDFHTLDCDAMIVAPHKVGGLANSGILVARRDVSMDLPGKGAGQERGIRPGTQDVVMAAACAAACERAEREREAEARRLKVLRDTMVKQACRIPGVELATSAPTVPDVTQFILSQCEAESVLFVFDQHHICLSAGSACRSGVARPSPVLLAQGYDPHEAIGALRVSIGWATTREDIDEFLRVLPRAIDVSRRLYTHREKRI